MLALTRCSALKVVLHVAMMLEKLLVLGPKSVLRRLRQRGCDTVTILL